MLQVLSSQGLNSLQYLQMLKFQNFLLARFSRSSVQCSNRKEPPNLENIARIFWAENVAEKPVTSLVVTFSRNIHRKRAEYGFGEYGFKHRTQWVFGGSLSSGERTQWVPFSLLFVCKRELTEFFAELTEFAPKLSEAQWVFFSETVLSKQYSARFLIHRYTHQFIVLEDSLQNNHPMKAIISESEQKGNLGLR